MGLSTVKTLQKVLFSSRPLRGPLEIEWRWVPVRSEQVCPHTLTFFSPCVPCCITIHVVTYLFCLWPKGNTFEEINPFFLVHCYTKIGQWMQFYKSNDCTCFLVFSLFPLIVPALMVTCHSTGAATEPMVIQPISIINKSPFIKFWITFPLKPHQRWHLKEVFSEFQWFFLPPLPEFTKMTNWGLIQSKMFQTRQCGCKYIPPFFFFLFFFF